MWNITYPDENGINIFQLLLMELRLATLLKKRLWHRCFPVNFVKFLRTPFLQNTSCGCFCFLQSRYDKDMIFLS